MTEITSLSDLNQLKNWKWLYQAFYSNKKNEMKSKRGSILTIKVAGVSLMLGPIGSQGYFKVLVSKNS